MRLLASLMLMIGCDATATAVDGGNADAPAPISDIGYGDARNDFASASNWKTPIQGLVDRNGTETRPAMPMHVIPTSYYPVVQGYVVNVGWKDLEPTQGVPLPSNNPIDQALAYVRRVNASGAAVSLRIRLSTGINAPDWAKQLGGFTPIQINDPLSGEGGTIGPFWTAPFRDAYNKLQIRLAAQYDGVPEIREITMSRCMTVYAEVFMRDTSTTAVTPAAMALLGAGFTVAQDMTCLTEMVDASKVWSTTLQSFTMNPYEHLYDTPGPNYGKAFSDETFTETLMAYCRTSLGKQCLLENNSIRQVNNGRPAMYLKMQMLGPPIAFQTAVLNNLGDLDITLNQAIGYGANSVELPNTYESQGGEFAPSALMSYDTQLTLNPL